MTRSIWKGPYIENSLLYNKELFFKTWSRNSIILPHLIGKRLQVYNGKQFILLNITEEMVGYRLGEFVATRKPNKLWRKNK